MSTLLPVRLRLAEAGLSHSCAVAVLEISPGAGWSESHCHSRMSSWLAGDAPCFPLSGVCSPVLVLGTRHLVSGHCRPFDAGLRIHCTVTPVKRRCQ